MQPHKLDSNGAHEMGRKAEELFEWLMKLLGFVVTGSTRNQNMKKHIDFFCTKGKKKWSFDVKGDKRERRHVENVAVTMDKVIWIEIQNEKHYMDGEYTGWLYGSAQMIAFYIEEYDHFIAVPRKLLIPFVESNIDYSKIVRSVDECREHRCLYRRKGKDYTKIYELTTIITMGELLSLEHFIISKAGIVHNKPK